MKKRILTIVTVMMTAVMLVACGGDSKKDNKITDNTLQPNKETEDNSPEDKDTEEDTTKTSSEVKNITADDLAVYPETEAEYFRTDFSREALNGVDGEITIREYTGTDSIVVIPKEIDGKKVVSIENAAFGYSSEVTAVYIPETMINICESAFDSESLRLVVFAEGTKKIGDFAFSGLKNLETVKLPDSLEELGATVFADCSALREIELPEKLTKIDQYVFSLDENLTITLGDNIESVDILAFEKSKNITVIVKEGTASHHAIESYNESVTHDDYPKVTIQLK